MIAAQSKFPSLAGLFNIPQSQGCTPCRQHPKHFGDRHSAKESAQCGGSEHRLNICPMFESYISVIPVSKQCRNRDLYGEAGGDVLTSQDIKKQSTKKCFGQKAAKKKGSTANATLSTTANGYQPFGSIPRLSSSLRNKRFIHPERLSSPSSCMAIDSRSYSSGSNLSCTAKRSFLLSLVDIINHLSVSFPNVDNVYQRQQKQNPVSADTPTRFLTTTDRLSIEEAMKENTTPAQGRHSLNLKTGNEQQSFIWIIAAIRRDCPTIKATIHHIPAPTEREARQSLVKDHVCFFAGRINQAVSHV